MSFTTSVIIDAAPLLVSFTDTTPGLTAAWEWTFGDGESSNLQNPVHIYTSEGRYDVSLTVTYSDTTTEVFTIEDCILVDTISMEAETVCLRFATENNEGYGWSELTGDNIAIPFNNYGSMQITDDNGIKRDIIIDKNDFSIYEVGTFDRIINIKPPALDKDVEEISWEKWERETTFDQTEEQRRISHQSSYINIRPVDDKFRSASGYTSTGQRSQQELSLEAYVNGEKKSPAAKAVDIKENGEVSFQGRTVDDNRVQMVISGSSSEIKITGHVHQFLGIIGSPTPSLRTTGEHDIATELVNDKVIHLTRGYRARINRVTGLTLLTGLYQTIEGPDKRNSASLSEVDIVCDNIAYSSNCTIILWSKEISLINGITEWSTFGVPVNSWIMYYKKIPEGIPENIVIAAGSKFDVRVYSKIVSDKAIERLYDDVVNFEGNAFLPGF